MDPERFDAVVIGAGQAGLSAGYYLKKGGHSFVILDGQDEIGGSWLTRYDSLHLFTPRFAVRLPGMRFEEDARYPSRDQMIGFLQAYARRYEMPVRTGVRVERVMRDGDGLALFTNEGPIEADNVIVATGAHRDARVPAFARDLDPSIVQMHSSAYRNPSQLQDGGVLVVGAGNSGADISLDAVQTHRTWLSGPDRGHIPVSIDTWFAQNVVFRVLRFFMTRVVTVRTPIGRRSMAKRAGMGDMLVRVKPKQLLAAGVERVDKTVAVRDGRPVLEDGTVLDVSNVIWATGYRHDLSWIDLPVFGEDGELIHERGVVASEPGLYFVGLPWQYSAASDVIPGVGRDARFVVNHLLSRRSSMRGDVAAAA
jgi:putative flavoprotein involved in K+ transport